MIAELHSSIVAMRAALSNGLLNRLLSGLLCVIGLALSSPLHADSSGEAFGSAYSADGATLLYTEIHHWHGVVHTVEYFRPDGELLAVNELDSTISFISPVYRQHYPRDNFIEGARWRGGKLVLFSGTKEQVVGFEPPLVISSGFYHFILEHWQDLQAGKSIAFDFAVPSRLTTVRLRMHALSDGAAIIGGGDSNWRYVRVDAANPLLRWLVQPLTVAIDDRQRLMAYRGAANVRDEHGDTPQVLIRYSYPTQPPNHTAAPAASSFNPLAATPSK